MTDWGEEEGVPAPVPPDNPDAWYAPDVCAQDEVHPGVVATIRETDEAFAYEVREPSLTAAGSATLDRIRAHFTDAHLERPVTREGAIERMNAGFEPKSRRVIDRLVDCTPARRRRVDYHTLADLRCLGELTPSAHDSPHI